MSDIIERLQDQSLQLTRRSFDSVDAGLAANVADAAIDEIQRLRDALRAIAGGEFDYLKDAMNAARTALSAVSLQDGKQP